MLIEVQYAANGAFFRRLNEYCLMIRKQQPMLPIAVVFCIHNTSQEFKDLTYDCEAKPFSKRVYCHGWAQECYFISATTISAYLDRQPLHPLAALGHFFTEQKLSVLGMAKRDDPTIKLLYGIAKRVFEDEAANEDARQDAINIICSKAASQFNQAMSVLVEDVPESQAQKRTRDCLHDGLELMEELRTKYITVSSSASTSAIKGHLEPPLPSSLNDWQFVDNYRKQHGTKMDWVSCYEAGKNIGLFGKYTSLKSVQAAYYRAINKKK